jgi:prenyltransferase beta subunit
MYKMLVLGNGESGGLSTAIVNYYNATWLGRTKHGMDITEKNNRQMFTEISLDYDVVVISAYGHEYSQVLLLKEIWEHWVENNKVGKIIAIGSSCDRLSLNQDSDINYTSYAIEKLAIREMVGMINAYKKHRVYASIISPHHVNTAQFKYDSALEPLDVVSAIDFVLTSNFHVEEISLRNFDD